MEFVAPFGSWLKQRRAEFGMTRGDLARRINYSIETLHKIEGGAIKASPHVAERLIEPLEVPAALRDAFIAFATGTEPHHRPHNLPAPVTPLVGRERELAMARKWLRNDDIWLITFVGLPGVGKTHLALHVAWDAHDRYEHGAWFVPLAAITDASAVPTAIAIALEVPVGAGEDALANVKRRLREQHALLVLDHFEQVLAADLYVAELLSAAPRLHILATSRAALNLRGEHLFEVPPLDDEPAVELFAQRAAALKSDFKLDHNASVVSEICTRLDRLPLAIELVASRIRLFDPPQLLARLDPSLGLLASTAKDLPPQHRTSHDAIGASYALLGTDERSAYRCLDANWLIEWTQRPDPIQDELKSLWGRALLSVSILMELQDAGHDIRHRTIERSVAVLTQAGDVDHLADALAELSKCDWVAGDYAQAAVHAERSLGLRTQMGDPRPIVNAQVWLAAVWRDTGEYDQAEAMFNECIALCRELADANIEAMAENGMGDLEYDRGDLAKSRRHYEAALDLWRKHSSYIWARVLPQRGLGRIACLEGDLPQAEMCLWQVVQVAEQENACERSFCLQYYAWLKHLQGNDESARRFLRQAIESQQSAASRLNLVESLERAAWLAADQHEPKQAARLFGACAAARERMGTPQPAGDHAFHERAVALARRTGRGGL